MAIDGFVTKALTIKWLLLCMLIGNSMHTWSRRITSWEDIIIFIIVIIIINSSCSGSSYGSNSSTA